jgi:hypothetical protein
LVLAVLVLHQRNHLVQMAEILYLQVSLQRVEVAEPLADKVAKLAVQVEVLVTADLQELELQTKVLMVVLHTVLEIFMVVAVEAVLV